MKKITELTINEIINLNWLRKEINEEWEIIQNTDNKLLKKFGDDRQMWPEETTEKRNELSKRFLELCDERDIITGRKVI